MFPVEETGDIQEKMCQKSARLCVTSLFAGQRGRQRSEMCALQVEGLSGELEKNVRAQLSTIQSDEVTPDRRFRARVDDAIREGLKALGYYEPTIEFDLRPPPKEGRQVPDRQATPGETGAHWRNRGDSARRRPHR